MQASICVEFGGKHYKVAWINEDHNGVYVGIYGKHRGLHASYHKDGVRHITQSGSKKRIPDINGPPIKDLQTNHEILAIEFPFTDNVFESNASIYVPSNKTDLNVVIGRQVLDPDKILVIGAQIVNARIEKQLLKTIFPTSKSTTLISYYLWRLEFFPAHKVGVIIYQKSTKNNIQ